MIVRFHKTSHKDYTLECIRHDGTVLRALFEAKSCLSHDMLHFQIESKAGLRDSFFGSIAKGKSIEEMSMADQQANPAALRSEGEVTEMVAGAMTSVAKGAATPQQLLEMFANLMTAYGTPMPEYLTEEFAAAVAADWRQMMAQYDALKTGQLLEVSFPDRV